MTKKNNFLFPISLFIFYLLEIFLLQNKQFQLGIFFYLLYVVLLYMNDKRNIIIFFVFHLPLLPVIPTDYKLFGLVGPHEIIYGSSFYVLYGMKKKFRNKSLNKYQKLSIKFIYFLFFIQMYVIIKDTVLGLNPKFTGVVYILKNMIRYYLYYMSLIFLIQIFYKEKLLNYVLSGVKYSVVFLVVSMLFTDYLISIGADIAGRKAYLSKEAFRSRFSGFYGAGGDQNSIGVFLASTLGFFMALFEKSRSIKSYIIFIGFVVLGILLTGSRTAFLSTAIIFMVFLITNKSGSAKFYILISVVLFYFIFNKQLNLVFQRFLDPSAVAAIDPKSDGRIFKWIYYTEWLLDNPKTFIIGNQIRIPFKAAPHNFFIYIVYHTGIVILFVFIRLFIKLLKIIKLKESKFSLKNIYYILPIPFAIMTVNSFGSSIYLWIFLVVGAIYLPSKV